MIKITSISPKENYLLQLRFDNGVEKIFDLKPYLDLPVFSPLKSEDQFKQVINKGYFIEWTKLEVDLSADTLWHEGKNP